MCVNFWEIKEDIQPQLILLRLQTNKIIQRNEKEYSKFNED